MKTFHPPQSGGDGGTLAHAGDMASWMDVAGLPGAIGPLDTFPGTSGNDTLTGSANADTFDLTAGGNDTANGLAGNDTFVMGTTLTAADALNGGADNDTVTVSGTFPALTLGTNTFNSIESLVVAAGASYNITLVDANIAKDATLLVDATALGSSNALTFNASAETNGHLNVFGGAGNDVITTGAGADVVNVSQGGVDTINLGGDSYDPSFVGDSVNFGAAFTAADSVDGGDAAHPFNAFVTLSGNYSAGVTLGAHTLVNIGGMFLESGHAAGGQNFSYTFTTNDATVAAGQDFLVYGFFLASNEVLHFDGSAETNGSFSMIGGAGNDVLTGGAGNDYFDGGAGNDTFNGGAGRNLIDYFTDTGGVSVNLTQGSAHGTAVGSDTFTNIQDVNGGSGNDTLTGDGNDNWLWGFGGSDTLTGGGGNDLIQAGDMGVGSPGTDMADGGTGTDTLSFFDDGDIVAGKKGATFSLALEGSFQATGVDSIDAQNFENVAGTNGKDTLTGDSSGNTLYGGASADTLIGGDGNDALFGDKLLEGGLSSTGGREGPPGIVNAATGTGGNDVLMGGAGDDTLDGGEGNNTASYTDATSGVTVNLTIASAQNVGGGDGKDTLLNIQSLTGSGFDDTLTGSAGANTLDGGAGNDTFFTGGGNDTVLGGDGDDIVYFNAAGSLAFTGGSGTDTLDAHLVSVATSFVLASDVETFIGGSGADTVTVQTGGAAVNQTMQGGDGNDSLSSGAGNDTLDGGNNDDTLNISVGGNDTVTGDAGNDTIVAVAVPASTDSGLNSADHLDGGTGSDTLDITGDLSAGFVFAAAAITSIEKIVLGAGFSYRLTTNDANVAAGQPLTVDGSGLGSGNTLIFNGAHETDGTFVLLGGAGNDTLTGGLGADTIDGGAGNNKLHGGGGADVINIGSGGNDTVTGDAGNDIIAAVAAPSSTNPGINSADHLDGGDGADTLDITGDLSAGFSFGATTLTSIETIVLGAGFSYRLTTNDGNVAAGQSLTVDGSGLGTGTLIFNGTKETDGTFVLKGGGGGDTLTGGAGADSINGGAGNNKLHGGGGDDTITISSGGNDTVTGDAGNDTIVASSASPNTGLNAADQLDGGDGTDTLAITGDLSAGFTFGAATLTSIETIVLGAGFSYRLTTNDGNVAAGQSMTIDGSGLGTGTLKFDGSHETDGAFVVTGASGNDTLIGGAGGDKLHGGDGSDTINISAGGNDTVTGDAGNDTIVATGLSSSTGLTAADHLDGGAGSDTLSITGDLSAGFVLGATTLTSIETIVLGAGFSYKLTANDGNVAASQSMTIDGSGLGTGTLNFDGSHETNGTFMILGGGGNDTLAGGAGADTITGGGGQDKLNGGAGNDIFKYAGVPDSTGSTRDIITGFDGSNDRFDLAVTVTGIDTALTMGQMRTGSHFDADLSAAVGSAQLAAGHAVLFTADSGNLSGHTFLIVDANGTAGYQAGADYVIELASGTDLGSIGTSTFI